MGRYLQAEEKEEEQEEVKVGVERQSLEQKLVARSRWPMVVEKMLDALEEAEEAEDWG